MDAAQYYLPYRTEILSRDELRELTSLRPSIVLRDMLVNWIIIIAGWILVAYSTTWITVGLAIVVIGTRYYSLAIVGHDGLHRRLFNSQETNDLWNDLLILGPICTITRINRHNHMEHHRAAALPHNPD